MSMAVVEMTWGLLVISVNMWFNYQDGLRPWTNWANVHSNFSRIQQFPALEIPKVTLAWTFALWWTIPFSSIIFFVFFSFGKDALDDYRACFAWVRRVILRQTALQATSTTLESISPFPESVPLFRSFIEPF
jgi:pheromone a factor receptor